MGLRVQNRDLNPMLLSRVTAHHDVGGKGGQGRGGHQLVKILKIMLEQEIGGGRHPPAPLPPEADISVEQHPLPVNKERMEQNMDTWDFALTSEDMDQIAQLDIGRSEIVDHYDPAFVKMLHGLKIHP